MWTLDYGDDLPGLIAAPFKRMMRAKPPGAA